MSTNKKLSLIALVSLMSSVALPVVPPASDIYRNQLGRNGGGIYHKPLPRASDIYGAGVSNFDSLGLSQPVYLSDDDMFQEGSSSVNLEPGLEIPTDSQLAPNQLGRNGGGVQKKQPARFGRDGHGIQKKQPTKLGGKGSILNPKYPEYKNAVNEIARYKTRLAKYNEGLTKTQPTYPKRAFDTEINYLHPNSHTSNEIIA
ncbi:MAG: hypothetical protein WC747_04090 [Candidatus Babeliales bacterium]|jgi:hypothetical protein